MTPSSERPSIGQSPVTGDVTILERNLNRRDAEKNEVTFKGKVCWRDHRIILMRTVDGRDPRSSFACGDLAVRAVLPSCVRPVGGAGSKSIRNPGGRDR